MRGKFSLGLTAAVVAILMGGATPVFAQDGPTTQSFFEMFFLSKDVLGLIIIWFLLILSAVDMGLMIMFGLKFGRNKLIPLETFTQIETMVEAKQYREVIEFTQADDSFLSKLVAAALGEASNGYAAMERAIEETGDAETAKMLRPIEYLNVMGNIAPMLGLFGTVYGMIVAFQQLVAAGGKPNPAELAAGISTALVTTFWGLVVAMPALAAYALLRNRVDALTAEGMLMAEELIRPFKPGAKKKSSSSSSSSSSGGKPARPAPAAKPGA